MPESERRKGERRRSEDRRCSLMDLYEGWDGVERRSKTDQRRAKERRQEDPEALFKRQLQQDRWQKERERQEKRQKRRLEKEMFRL